MFPAVTYLFTVEVTYADDKILLKVVTKTLLKENVNETHMQEMYNVFILLSANSHIQPVIVCGGTWGSVKQRFLNGQLYSISS